MATQQSVWDEFSTVDATQPAAQAAGQAPASEWDQFSTLDTSPQTTQPAAQPLSDTEVSSHIQEMIKNQRPAKEITDYLVANSRPIEPKFQESINQYEAARLQGKNPYYDVQAPDHLENFAASNASPLDAFLYQFAQNSGFQSLDEATAYAMSRGLIPSALIGDYTSVKNSNIPADELYQRYLEAARTELRGAQNNHPTASTTGAIAGGVTSGVAQNALVPGSGVAGALRSAGASAAVGGLTGYGAGEGDSRLGSAVTGAALGAATDLGLRGVANAVSPTVRPEVQALKDAGVRMTPGQIIGGVANSVEQAAGNANVPFVGQGIRSLRDQSLRDYQQLAANQVLEGTPLALVDPARKVVPGNPLASQMFQDLPPEQAGLDFNGIRVAARDVPWEKQAAGLVADNLDRIPQNQASDLVSQLERLGRARQGAQRAGRDVLTPRDIQEARFPYGTDSVTAYDAPVDNSTLGVSAGRADQVLGSTYYGTKPNVADAISSGVAGLATLGGLINPSVGLTGAGLLASRATYTPVGRSAAEWALTGRQGPAARTIKDTLDALAPGIGRLPTGSSTTPNNQ